MPYWEFLLPLAVGVTTGGLFIAVFQVLSRTKRTVSVGTGPPLEKKLPEFDPFVQGSASEKRSAVRRGGNTVAIFYQPLERKGQPLQGWVRDRSVGGLCLTVDEQLAPGTFLRILPTNAPDITPWVEVEVRSCRQSGDGYELGCQFLKQPPWSVLLLFG